MDSRSPPPAGSWFNCRFSPRQPWTSSSPRCQTYTGDPCRALHPSSHHRFTQNPQFFFIPAAPAQKPCIRLPQISAFSGFFLYLERSGSVFVCLLALATFSVFSGYFPHQFLFPSFLLPPPPLLCAHCKCGTWEFGRHNAGSFIPSCKHNGSDVET